MKHKIRFYSLLTTLFLLLTTSCSIAFSEETKAVVPKLEKLPTYSYTTRKIEVMNNGQRIYGVIYLPKKDGKLPLAICAHGLGSSYRSRIPYAKQFASHGIAAYCFDFRGGGPQSEGSPNEMSVMTEVSDMEAILSAAQRWDFVDTDKIMLLGSSQGGLVSAITAARHTDELAGLVLICPALPLPDAMRKRFHSLEAVPHSFLMGSKLQVGRRYVTDIWNLDVYAEIGKYTGKVLLMHGTDDTTVPISSSDRAAEIYTDVDYFKIEGAGHKISGSAFNKAIEHILTYVQEVGLLAPSGMTKRQRP